MLSLGTYASAIVGTRDAIEKSRKSLQRKDLATRPPRGRKSLIINDLGHLFHVYKNSWFIITCAYFLMLFLKYINRLFFKICFYQYFIIVICGEPIRI